MGESIFFQAKSRELFLEQLDIALSVAKKNNVSIDIDVKSIDDIPASSVFILYDHIKDKNLEDFVEYFLEGGLVDDEFADLLKEQLKEYKNRLNP